MCSARIKKSWKKQMSCYYFKLISLTHHLPPMLQPCYFFGIDTRTRSQSNIIPSFTTDFTDSTMASASSPVHESSTTNDSSHASTPYTSSAYLYLPLQIQTVSPPLADILPSLILEGLTRHHITCLKCSTGTIDKSESDID